MTHHDDQWERIAESTMRNLEAATAELVAAERLYAEQPQLFQHEGAVSNIKFAPLQTHPEGTVTLPEGEPIPAFLRRAAA